MKLTLLRADGGAAPSVEDAVREKLQRERQKRALQNYIESGERPDNPKWRTPEDTSKWVREMRQLDNQRLERKLTGTSD